MLGHSMGTLLPLHQYLLSRVCHTLTVLLLHYHLHLVLLENL